MMTSPYQIDGPTEGLAVNSRRFERGNHLSRVVAFYIEPQPNNQRLPGCRELKKPRRVFGLNLAGLRTLLCGFL